MKNTICKTCGRKIWEGFVIKEYIKFDDTRLKRWGEIGWKI